MTTRDGWAEAAAVSEARDASSKRRELDMAMIGRILDHESDLTAWEANFAHDVQAYLAASPRNTMSPKRLEVAEAIDERVSEGEYENAWSAGAVPSGAGLARPGRVHHFEQMARPLRPPGRT